MQSDDVSGNNVDNPETVNWDPNFTELAKKAVAPVGKRWFRSEVRGPDSVPRTGGGLVVCNHSGGGLTPDVLVFAPAFSDESCASRGHLGSVVGCSLSGISICVVRTAVRVL